MMLNPLAIVVETFKWGLFGVGELYRDQFAATSAAVLALICIGLTYFARAEARTIAER
jgi:ABC-type polysaccharide/polyol phosphate export permease